MPAGAEAAPLSASALGGSIPPAPTTTGVSRRRELDNFPEPGSAPGPVIPLSFSCFPMPGADGRTGVDQQRARATLGTHDPRSRDRRPGCAPGAHTLPNLLSSFGTPERRGRGGRNPATRGYRPLLPGGKCLGTFPAMFTGRKTGGKFCPPEVADPRRGRKRWQCGSQLRMTGRTDGPRKEKEGGVYGSTKAHPKANQLHPLRRRAAAPAENLLLRL